MLALEASRAADEAADPVAYASARVEVANALNAMTRQGVGDMSTRSAPILDEAIAILQRHLPAAREELMNAHYLAADMRRGGDWEGAREHFEAALELARRESEPQYWAALNEGLAAALIRGPRGDDPEIQERSLRLYQEALTIEPPVVPPADWAATAHGFALTLTERHRGNPAEDWATIVGLMGRALDRAFDGGEEVIKRSVFVMDGRARVAFGVLAFVGSLLPADEALGLARSGAEALDVLRDPDDALAPRVEELAAADGEVLDLAIGLLDAVDDRRGRRLLEDLRTDSPPPPQRPAEPAAPVELPFDSDEAAHVRAFLLAQELLENPATDALALERALQLCRASLAEVRSPAACGTGLFTVGLLAQHRPIGDRQANLEEARTNLEAVLELGDTGLTQRSTVLHNLGVVYKQRLAGVRADNLETAIGHMEAALEAMSADESPETWAKTASQLGNTYSERVLGDEADNVERALELYAQALERRPRDERPVEWAITKHNIGATLPQRRLGDRRANLEAALKHLEEALEVRAEAELPEHFALTQGSLADVHVALAQRGGDQALEHLDAAAGVAGIEAFYERCVASGVAVLRPLAATAWGTKDFYVEDPDGYIIAFGGR
jgi:tetratricopeptide (TPR) repeat protein